MTGDRTGQPVPDRIFDPTAADEVADELRFHYDMYLRDLAASGHSRGDAERLARQRFGDLGRVAEECRHLAQQREEIVRRHRTVANLASDVRFALRLLRHRPLFAVMAILPLALGIGAATTMYSIADAVMIRPLPFPKPDRLVAIWAVESQWRNSAVGIPWQKVVIGQGEYDALRDRAHTLSQVAAWSPDGLSLNRNGEIEELDGVRATASIFPLLGIHPLIGRVFRPEETRIDGPRIALLGWEAWQTWFAGDSGVVGRSIVADDTTHYTVVGVLPRGVRLDRTAPEPAIWLPAFTDSSERASQHNRSYRGLGRLAPGVTATQASADVAGILSNYKREWNGSTNGTSGRAAIWQDDQTEQARPSLLILSGAVFLLLLIACVNVATLMVGEAMRRRPEIFARRALGATPSRLARQLVTESVVIAGTGAALGVAVAWAGVRALVHATPAGIPGINDAHVDLRVLAVAVTATLVIGIGFGLVPAFALLRWSEHHGVRIGSGQTARGAVSLQRTLVAAEVALSLAMLIGCSLLGRSLVRLTSVDPGFVANGLFQVTLKERPAFWNWKDEGRQERFYAAAIAELRQTPGVTAVSGGSSGLFNGGSTSSPVRVEGVTYTDSASPPNLQQRVIHSGYLRTIGLPVAAGRDFNDDDRLGSELVAIVSRSAVARYWNGRPAIGSHVTWQAKRWTIVGVVDDLHDNALSRQVDPTIYLPATQALGHGTILVIRANANAGSLLSLVKRRLDPLDAAVTVQDVTPVRSLISHSYAEERYRTVLGALFGVLAAVLAGIGIFGVISRTVAQRLREAGIRVALGAPERSVMRLMLRDTLRGAAAGIAIGLALAYLLARAMAPYLFGESAFDPAAFAVGLVLLAGVVAVATIPPARRAARVDPVGILRSD